MKVNKVYALHKVRLTLKSFGVPASLDSEAHGGHMLTQVQRADKNHAV